MLSIDLTCDVFFYNYTVMASVAICPSFMVNRNINDVDSKFCKGDCEFFSGNINDTELEADAIARSAF